MVRHVSGGRLLSSLGLVAVGVAVGIALGPRGGAAGSVASDPIQAFIGAVRRPSAGQFPTPQAAVRFLVEQVRTQNYVEAMRVMPIVERYDRATFPLQVMNLQSFTADSFFPGQPVSKFTYAATQPLFGSYTQFTLDMLVPKLILAGAIIVPDAAKLKEIEAQLDTKRLARMKVKSMSAPKIESGALIGKGDGSGVTSSGTLTAVVAGIGRDRKLRFDLEKIGTNWLVTFVSTP